MSHSEWVTVVREKASAEANMAMDSLLLRRLACAPQPVLHLYDWESPSITHGYFVDPDSLLYRKNIEDRGIQLAQRPTGGGVILHTVDFAFSILIPSGHKAFSTNTIENYARINTMVAQVIQKMVPHSKIQLLECKQSLPNGQKPFCMADPTVYDVMIDGKKAAGGAQRRTKHGFLHQGSISLTNPDPIFLGEILRDPAIADLMMFNTYPVAGENASIQNIVDARCLLSDLMKKFVKELV